MDDYVNIVDLIILSIILICTWLMERIFRAKVENKEEFHYYIKKYPNKKFYWEVKNVPSEEIKHLIHEENYERSE